MNKFGLFIALFALTMMSCTNQSNKQANENDDQLTTDETIIDHHTSQTSLDFIGVYTGILPCADCEGIETMIELKEDNYYISHYKYLGKSGEDNEFSNEGPFTWNDDGNSISLQAEGEPTQYKVGENHIILLNAEGELNTGDMADLYVLKKRM